MAWFSLYSVCVFFLFSFLVIACFAFVDKMSLKPGRTQLHFAPMELINSELFAFNALIIFCSNIYWSWLMVMAHIIWTRVLYGMQFTQILAFSRPSLNGHMTNEKLYSIGDDLHASCKCAYVSFYIGRMFNGIAFLVVLLLLLPSRDRVVCVSG